MSFFKAPAMPDAPPPPPPPPNPPTMATSSVKSSEAAQRAAAAAAAGAMGFNQTVKSSAEGDTTGGTDNSKQSKSSMKQLLSADQ